MPSGMPARLAIIEVAVIIRHTHAEEHHVVRGGLVELVCGTCYEHGENVPFPCPTRLRAERIMLLAHAADLDAIVGTA